MGGSALERQSSRRSTDFVTSWTALLCALLLRTRNVKKRKKFWVHPITSQRLLRGKFYSLYEDLKAHPQKFFLDVSECLVQYLINCWFCLVQVLHFKIPEWKSPCHQKDVWCVFVRASLHMRREENPTRCHCMLYCTYDMLNMFRALMCP